MRAIGTGTIGASWTVVFLAHELTVAASDPADGRFGKQDFIYQLETDTYRCPAGEQLIWRYTTVENGLTLSRYWSSNYGTCAMKATCTPSKQRRITRWEHEAVIEAMQRRPDEMPNAMRVRRSIVEHVFGTTRIGWGGTTS